MKQKIRLIIALMLFSPVACLAGATKTGGSFEIMADAIGKAGKAPETGGNLVLYQSAGQKAGNIISSGGAYTIVSGFLGVVDETPPAVSIASPAQNASVNGSASVLGTSFDENDSAWSLSYGPGQSPSLWKQIGSGTANTVSSQLAAWDTSNLYGTYTLRIVGTDTRGNTATATTEVNVWNQYLFSATIPAEKWSMVSFPGNPLDPDPRSFLGNSVYEVQRWDPMQAADEYDMKYKFSFPVTAGDGFWIKPYRTSITYSLPVAVQNTTQNVEKRLENGWNQIGIPLNRAVAWNTFQFKRDGDASPVSINTAIGNGWLDSKLYSYANNGYQANDATMSLQPFAGYFVRAYTGGTLLLDPGTGMPGGLARIIRPVYEWRMQIVAQTDSARDAENYLGEMKGATDTFNPADSAEPPVIEPYVTAYFPHPEWGAFAGRFAADIRSSQVENPTGGKTWKFIVKTSEVNKPVTLSWPDAAAVPGNYQITIRDDETGRGLDPRSEPQYSFSTGADGTRAFTITAKITDTGGVSETILKTTIPTGWSLLSVPLETTITDVREQLGDTLSRLSIYQQYDQRLFDPYSADHVDIQAGTGYWTYAESPVEAGFRGTPIPDGETVDVPLTPGWNIIGNPFGAKLIFGDNLHVTYGGEKVSLSEAAQRGWIVGRLYRYEKETDDYQVLEPGSTMMPWEGYMLKAAESATLHIKNR